MRLLSETQRRALQKFFQLQVLFTRDDKQANKLISVANELMKSTEEVKDEPKKVKAKAEQKQPASNWNNLIGMTK